jgi:hypothetical protein
MGISDKQAEIAGNAILLMLLLVCLVWLGLKCVGVVS